MGIAVEFNAMNFDKVCLDCGVWLYRFRSRTPIQQELNEKELEKGEYPVLLCFKCWSFWVDRTKDAKDNPRSMSRVGI